MILRTMFLCITMLIVNFGIIHADQPNSVDISSLSEEQIAYINDETRTELLKSVIINCLPHTVNTFHEQYTVLRSVFTRDISQRQQFETLSKAAFEDIMKILLSDSHSLHKELNTLDRKILGKKIATELENASFVHRVGGYVLEGRFTPLIPALVTALNGLLIGNFIKKDCSLRSDILLIAIALQTLSCMSTAIGIYETYNNVNTLSKLKEKTHLYAIFGQKAIALLDEYYAYAFPHDTEPLSVQVGKKLHGNQPHRDSSND
jgi:hypothetical protein